MAVGKSALDCHFTTASGGPAWPDIFAHMVIGDGGNTDAPIAAVALAICKYQLVTWETSGQAAEDN